MSALYTDEENNEEQPTMSSVTVGLKSALELLKTVPFLILLSAADGTRAKTNVVSSKDLTSDTGEEISDVTLLELRELCKLPSKCHFCFHNDANNISEGTSLGSYVSCMKENVAALRDADAENMDAVLTVYYRSMAAAQDEWARLGDSQTSSTQPAEMTEHDWNVVLLNNSLLHGLIFDPESKTFKPAREPAFKLSKHYGDRYNLRAGDSNLQSSLDNESDDEDDKFLTPDFRVVDDSSVTITEVRNSVQQSMTDQSFSSWSVEAALSGGFDGFTGGAKASGGQSSEDIKQAAQTEELDLMHASYNFPRVEVLLDTIDLELSDSCKAFCMGQPVDVVLFYKKYGTIFSSSVTLGARLHTTVASRSFMTVTSDTTKEEKKAAFALTFSSPFASAEAGGSTDTSSEKTGTQTTTNSSRDLSWNARGGETFLGTDPNAWINTVGFYQNWRVIERGGVLNIFDLALSMADGATSFISAYGTGQWTIESNDVSLPGSWSFSSYDSSGGIKISQAGKYLDVENSIPRSATRFSTTARKWEVRLASNSKSFFFCIPDSSQSMMLALDYPTYTNELVVNPLDPKNPTQIWHTY